MSGASREKECFVTRPANNFFFFVVISAPSNNDGDESYRKGQLGCGKYSSRNHWQLSSAHKHECTFRVLCVLCVSALCLLLARVLCVWAWVLLCVVVFLSLLSISQPRQPLSFDCQFSHHQPSQQSIFQQQSKLVKLLFVSCAFKDSTILFKKPLFIYYDMINHGF